MQKQPVRLDVLLFSSSFVKAATKLRKTTAGTRFMRVFAEKKNMHDFTARCGFLGKMVPQVESEPGGVGCRIQNSGEEKEKNSDTQKSNFTGEEKRQKHRTLQFPVGEERIGGWKAGGGSRGASSGVSYRTSLQTFLLSQNHQKRCIIQLYACLVFGNHNSSSTAAFTLNSIILSHGYCFKC